MNGGPCRAPPQPTNCSEITLFEVSPAKSLSKGKTTSKCLQVCVGIVYDATVSMSLLLLGLGLGGGGAQVDVASLGSTHWNLPFPPVQWLVSVLRDNSTVGTWQVLPEVTGSEGVNRGGGGGGGVADSPYCVCQNVSGHALGWDSVTSGDTTVGCDWAA